MKTSELTGVAIDWAVAKCEAYPVSMSKTGYLIFSDPLIQCGPRGTRYSPSSNWAQGGPIIEREWLYLEARNDAREWRAGVFSRRPGPLYADPTPLIAAMRCYVASKLGDEVELPKELAE